MHHLVRVGRIRHATLKGLKLALALLLVSLLLFSAYMESNIFAEDEIFLCSNKTVTNWRLVFRNNWFIFSLIFLLGRFHQ